MLAATCHEPKSVKYHLSHLSSIVLFSLFDQIPEYYQRMTANMSIRFHEASEQLWGFVLVHRNSSGLYQGSTFTHNHTGMGDKTEPSSAFQNISSRLPQEKSPALNRLPKNTLEVKRLYFRVNSFTVLFFPGGILFYYLDLWFDRLVKKKISHEKFIWIQMFLDFT